MFRLFRSWKNRRPAGRLASILALIGLLVALPVSAFYVFYLDADDKAGWDAVFALAASLEASGSREPIFIYPKSEMGRFPERGVDVTRLVMTSDPQYPWVEGSLCPNCNVEKESQRLITQQYQSINNFAAQYPVAGVFVNGDLTAFGHLGEVNWMKGALSKLTPPVYLGLGNHDYENNVNRCAENSCAIGSVRWFFQEAQKSADRFDGYKAEYYAFPIDRDVYSGSLAYSKSFGNIHVIQVNNSADYVTSFSGYHRNDLIMEEFNISSAIPWLEDELSWARANGKVIVIAMHKPIASRDLETLVKRYEVTAVFAGHLHSRLGLFATWGDTPVLLSGSASWSTYLIAEFDHLYRELKVYSVRNNNPSSKALVGTYPFRDSSKKLPPVLAKPSFAIQATNAGGYNAKFRLRYVDGSGQRVETWTGDILSGKGKIFWLPGNATQVELQGVSLTGVVWSPTKVIFDERLESMSYCFSTWGTTLNPKHSKTLCGYYGERGTTLMSTSNHQCMDIKDSVAAGNRLIAWPCHGGKNQLFEVVGDTIQVGGLCLDVAGGQNKEKAEVILWSCHGKDNQRWKVEHESSGAVRIRSLMSGTQRCLDLITEEGNRIGLWTCHATHSDQRFYTSNTYWIPEAPPVGIPVNGGDPPLGVPLGSDSDWFLNGAAIQAVTDR